MNSEKQEKMPAEELLADVGGGSDNSACPKGCEHPDAGCSGCEYLHPSFSKFGLGGYICRLTGKSYP